MRPSTFTNFVSILDVCLLERDTRDAYLDSVPVDIKCSVFDNGYTNSMERTLSALIVCALGEELADDLNWFLYEWDVGYKVILSEKEYVINNKADYISCVKEVYFDGQ